MNELGHGHAFSMYGAEMGSRNMHRSFYGSEALISQSHVTGATQADQISQNLASKEWQKAGLDGIFPPELVEIISQLTASLGSKFNKLIDYLSEAVNAEQLRQKFGEPQVPGALAVFIRLTELTELAFDETQTVAFEVEKEIAFIKAEIKKTIFVWLLAEEARHQATMAELTKTETELTALNVQTKQAGAETSSVKNIILDRKAEVAVLIRLASEKVGKFFSQMFDSNTLGNTEVIVFSAQKTTANLPSLDAEKAIPLTAVVT